MILRTMFTLLSAVLFMTTCKKNKADDELFIIRAENMSTHLTMNGYYYLQYPLQSGGYRYDIYFFYSNGIILYGESPSDSSLPQIQTEYKSGAYYQRVKNIKYYWGVYKVEGTNIKFERWYPSERPYRAYVREGKILNDTTFQITESYRMKEGQKTEAASENETYYFKHFLPKPDSTNTFVK